MTFGQAGEHQAREDGLAIEQHRARAAVAFVAALLGTGKPQAVPEDFEQRPVVGRAHVVGIAVHLEEHDEYCGACRCWEQDRKWKKLSASDSRR